MNTVLNSKNQKILLLSSFLVFFTGRTQAQKIENVSKKGETSVEVLFSDNKKLLIDFYGENLFRLFLDPKGGKIRNPEATPPAQILVDQPRKKIKEISISNLSQTVSVSTAKTKIEIEKATSLFKVFDLNLHKEVFSFMAPIEFNSKEVVLTLSQRKDEYFYGGGVQNGRFSHKGNTVFIVNQNNWTDGGVASPNPYYWSTNGYGCMWHTFKKGYYDFGKQNKNVVKLAHETNYLDVFFMVDDSPKSLLNDFYQLTGNPVLLPKFGFYEGHLNAYNRDYWKEDVKGIPFEDGKRYKESQKDNGGIKESLNGEKNNYQFSARAVIDRYKNADMPLGWILPNDGYGAGYGQTETLEGNIANLKSFGDYARKNGVEIGLWTQSDLHPKEGVAALLQRDIIKEVEDAGVRVLKTDVAWVGPGYSFGLNGISDVAQIMPRYGNGSRPFIISLDGWAGSQRYAGIWTGDQTGGEWEYIRFHIPTYIGSGLSGQPNITSDMDGIFGGQNPVINIRDFQWKTFTPMQLNMDGWGTNEKYPQALGESAASINRNYLKLKSSLLPYTYSVAKEAVDGLPIMRAMFLQQPNDYTLGKFTQYQYLYGPYFLVAPVYQATKMDKEGNDIRNNIYLPKGNWIDYFTGQTYVGGIILNHFDAPIWKLPLFVKPGAIIPMVNANNNVHQINKKLRIYEVYPSEKSSFTEYDDDGITENYKKNESVHTLIESNVIKNTAVISISPSQGNFKGFEKEKMTEFRVNVTQKPSGVKLFVGGKNVNLKAVNTLDEFNKEANVYFYNSKPEFNNFSTKDSEFSKVSIIRNPQLWVKTGTTDISKNKVELVVEGYQFSNSNQLKNNSGVLAEALKPITSGKENTPYSILASWNKIPNADYYEILYNDMVYSNIKGTSFLFDELTPETKYDFKLRAVNKTNTSEWVSFSSQTNKNPYEFAIKGIKATATIPSQEGEGIENLVDQEVNTGWHSDYEKSKVPFDIILDLGAVNTISKIEYIPRISGYNGIWLKGKISYSDNKKEWKELGSFAWDRNNKPKSLDFAAHPATRFIKIEVSSAFGNFASGNELYVFKVPGSASLLPGDINNDQKIDMNDFTSYINYTGLRKGDSDFEGYISNGDINKNGLIDAFDISNVATKIDGGVNDEELKPLQGSISISASKQQYTKNDIVEVVVKGSNLQSVNALSFAMPYNQQELEYIGMTPLNIGQMENLTYDRLHTNKEKVLYPTLVNIGQKYPLEGTRELFIIKFKAKRNGSFNIKAVNGLLVDKTLNSIDF
ncbi:DUF5110 domain-containing protein [Chryseobacterium sp. X308]|uniref:TIM-barrel domain-containing protein n=1 Tax=Chryseobacterium sp. X308 TaxID=2884873 RepID=UPI001D14101C|nr:TIM-barrel domain-containing protein [Chryseobacterium sp. X308]MCC3216248.1 DUF5110 domain-containing protein [Chryseobacterium sp. X308]